MDLTTFLAGAGGSFTTGGAAIWLFKRWMNRVDTRFDQSDLKFETMNKKFEETFKDIHSINVNLAKTQGEQTGKGELILGELRLEKEENTRQRKEIDKLWQLIHKISAKLGIESKRVSDLIDESL